MCASVADGAGWRNAQGRFWVAGPFASASASCQGPPGLSSRVELACSLRTMVAVLLLCGRAACAKKQLSWADVLSRRFGIRIPSLAIGAIARKSMPSFPVAGELSQPSVPLPHVICPLPATTIFSPINDACRYVYFYPDRSWPVRCKGSRSSEASHRCLGGVCQVTATMACLNNYYCRP